MFIPLAMTLFHFFYCFTARLIQNLLYVIKTFFLLKSSFYRSRRNVKATRFMDRSVKVKLQFNLCYYKTILHNEKNDWIFAFIDHCNLPFCLYLCLRT